MASCFILPILENGSSSGLSHKVVVRSNAVNVTQAFCPLKVLLTMDSSWVSEEDTKTIKCFFAGLFQIVAN